MLVFLLFGESAENPPSLGNIEVLIRVFIRKISIKLHMPFFSEKAMAAHSSTLTWKIPWNE